MFAIVIPTLNASATLPALLKDCQGYDIIVSDGLSSDITVSQAIAAGAQISLGQKSRGGQLARGVDWAFKTSPHEWVLVLHADCRLSAGWQTVVQRHIEHHASKIGYFTFGANAKGWQARFMEFVVRLRDIWPKLPYGDQGLLISKTQYLSVGGYPDQVLFEDVEIIRRLKSKYGRKVLRRMPLRLVSDVSAYVRDGFANRTRRNTKLLLAYNRGESVEALLTEYKRSTK